MDAYSGRSTLPAPSHERHFYSTKRAFGRFGIRIFDPVLMTQPHWHGHIEANFAIDFEMEYQVDGQVLSLPANRLVVFWAGVPHQLTKVTKLPGPSHKLCNIYLPLDAFLIMNHIAGLQVALLGGGMIVLPESLCSAEQLRRWYADYRSGDFERAELVKMELNALFRRAALADLNFLRPPQHEASGDRALSSAHIRHVIAMVRHVLENLEKPLRNSDITAVTGLHENYALSLFTQVMRAPLKQFVIRMRLMRARALLVESSLAIATVVEASGFSSISQFYAQFKAGYGLSPAALREQYLRMEVR
ncbi:MAG: helix-turn-helix domain-containing protein [Cypionkella sp.]|uniref:helix-turn-helix domain-containing protein n=1 Tax=Cypionkella sp. TaxID=2811411 RepID=UPI002ABBC68D|nr:helix-turn-helix domain-containing protein [Cypionkella sp.]MDZ4313060.1 helix-turn-helix domain-containing protein [Cypionkella sp.]